MNKRFKILLQSFAVAAFLLPVGAQADMVRAMVMGGYGLDDMQDDEEYSVEQQSAPAPAKTVAGVRSLGAQSVAVPRVGVPVSPQACYLIELPSNEGSSHYYDTCTGLLR